MTNQQMVCEDDFKQPIKAMSAGLSSAPHPSPSDCTTSTTISVVSVGTKICKRYDTGWYTGVVVTVVPSKSNSQGTLFLVHFEDGEEEAMGQDEVEAAALAYDVLYHHDNISCRGQAQRQQSLSLEPPPRPPIGTRIKKRFGDEWYLGAVIDQTPKRSLVLYQDDDEEYMSDSELRVTAAVYQYHYHPQRQPQVPQTIKKQEPKVEYG